MKAGERNSPALRCLTAARGNCSGRVLADATRVTVLFVDDMVNVPAQHMRTGFIGSLLKTRI
ncbi:MAG: hypothetical protein M0Q91_15575 [Methanoregula sp.]|nr:hypothetical protein [Methanoregula sp.]